MVSRPLLLIEGDVRDASRLEGLGYLHNTVGHIGHPSLSLLEKTQSLRVDDVGNAPSRNLNLFLHPDRDRDRNREGCKEVEYGR